MHSRKSICSLTSNKKATIMKGSLKPVPFLPRRMLTSGASTKASPESKKDVLECIENSCEKKSKAKFNQTFSSSPTPKLNPLKLNFQSDFATHNKRQRPCALSIREKKTRELKNSKMSIELRDYETTENVLFRLYHEKEIMEDREFGEKLNTVDCDNDCPTLCSQVGLAVKFTEDALRIVIEPASEGY